MLATPACHTAAVTIIEVRNSENSVSESAWMLFQVACQNTPRYTDALSGMCSSASDRKVSRRCLKFASMYRFIFLRMYLQCQGGASRVGRTLSPSVISTTVKGSGVAWRHATLQWRNQSSRATRTIWSPWQPLFAAPRYFLPPLSHFISQPTAHSPSCTRAAQWTLPPISPTPPYSCGIVVATLPFWRDPNP